MAHGPVKRAEEVFEHRLIVVRGGRWRDVGRKQCYIEGGEVPPLLIWPVGGVASFSGGLASFLPVPSFLLGRFTLTGPLRPSETCPSAVYIGFCAHPSAQFAFKVASAAF